MELPMRLSRSVVALVLVLGIPGTARGQASPAEPSPARAPAPDRLIGLLTLPEVFGDGACDRFEPREVPVHSAPDSGAAMGVIAVETYWTFHEAGGCGGLEVVFRDGASGAARPLPAPEYDYEAPAVVVLERRGEWFRVRLAEGSGWVLASERMDFLPLEELLPDRLTYLTGAWDGRLAATPGGALEQVRPGAATESFPFVRVEGFRQLGGDLWVRVAVLDLSSCDSVAEPRVLARGWLRAHDRSGEVAVWFHSRGC